MNTPKKMLILFWISSLMALGAVSCKEEVSTGSASKMDVYMTDAPSNNYDAVLIDLLRVEVNTSSDSVSGWNSIGIIKPGIYNLLDFRNGVDTLLASASLPVGKISQIRLILGANNKVVEDSVEYDLKVPSGMTSGLKLNVHAELQAGVTYKLWIDFDAGRSIVKKGNGNYSLKPVIRTFTQATSGAIKGVVSPAASKPYIYLLSGTDTISTFAEDDGRFMLRGVPKGVYDVNFIPGVLTVIKTVQGVVVNNGVVTDMDTVRVP